MKIFTFFIALSVVFTLSMFPNGLGSIIYVDSSAHGLFNGSSWTNAFTTLRNALITAQSGDQIWIAKGTYYPGTTRDKSFALKNGVALLGGFNGTETSAEQRDWVNNKTILSGDIGTKGNNGDNCYHVICDTSSTNRLDTTAILDGFVVSGGNGNGSYPENHGSGMLNKYSSPTIKNCTFEYNIVSEGGGGICNNLSSPNIINCIFRSNSAFGGGGLEAHNSRPSIISCHFIDNYGAYCGAIGLSRSSPAISDCIFTDNRVYDSGGAIGLGDGSAPRVVNCTFKKNIAEAGGAGAIWNWFNGNDSIPEFYNCTFNSSNGTAISVVNTSPIFDKCVFVDNSGRSSEDGGAFVISDHSFLTITNSTFFGNSDKGYNAIVCRLGGTIPIPSRVIIVNSILSDGGNEIRNEGNAEVVVAFSDIEGGYPGIGNLNTDPLFLDASNHDFTLSPGSPCIDAGTPNFIWHDTVVVAIDTSQYKGALPDMGASESEWSGTIITHNIDFETIDVGSYHLDSVIIYNHGFSPLQCDSIISRCEGVTINNVPSEILPGESKIVQIHYTPLHCGQLNGNIILLFNGNSILHKIHLTANVIASIRYNPSFIAFGEIQGLGYSRQDSIKIYNDGSGTLTLDTMYAGHPDISLQGICSTLSPGDSCTLVVAYTPTSYGAINCTLQFSYNGICAAGEINITGRAVYTPYQNGSWTHIGPAGWRVQDIAVSNGNIYAVADSSLPGSYWVSHKLLRSTDMGLTWIELLSTGGCCITPGDHPLVCVSGEGTIITNTDDNNFTLYRSTDGGSTWINPNLYSIGYCACPFTSISVSPTGTIFATLGYGCCSATGVSAYMDSGGYCWRSTDDGISWMGSPEPGNATAFYGDEVVLLAGGGQSLYWGWGNYKISNNGGETWIPWVSQPSLGPGQGITTISVSPNKSVLLGGSFGIIRSADLCTTWTSVSDLIPEDMLTIPSDKILAVTNRGGIYISTDDGNTWLSFNTGLTNLNVHTLAMDSLGYIYTGTDSGIFRTSLIDSLLAPSIVQHLNGGWNLLSLPIHPFNHCPSENYPGATSSAFMYSGSYYECNDLCVAKGYWLKLEGDADFQLWGHRTEVETVDVSIGWNIIGSLSDPFLASTITSEPAVIVTSSFMEYDGVKYNASDTIKSGKGYWVKVNQTGKLILSATGKAIASNRIRIVASNEQPPSPPSSEIPNPKSEIPKMFALEQNYPNPFNPVTIINYQLPVDSWVTIKVYNVLGQEVMTLVNEDMKLGRYEVEFDGAKLSSGLYFYRLTANNFIETKKLILMK